MAAPHVAGAVALTHQALLGPSAAQAMIVSIAVPDVVSDAGAESPNRLLNIRRLLKPAAPSDLRVTQNVVGPVSRVTLHWDDNSDNERGFAARYLGRERGGHTLQPTALVDEAYLRLIQYDDLEYKNRAHFVGIAARLMRQVLVDHARTRGAGKRGGQQERVTLDEAVALQPGHGDVDLLALDDALRKLSEKDAHLTRLVELRYFSGLSIEEAAEALGSSPATVKREWATAKVWLRRLMTGEGGRVVKSPATSRAGTLAATFLR